MPLIVYIDEAGDHSLERGDEGFPVFVLVLMICDISTYTQDIVPAVYQLKIDYFGHEGVILHSRDIRKAQGPFTFLNDRDVKQSFYERINQIMREAEYKLIASVIRKQHHKERYGRNAANPYDLSLEFALERLMPLLEEVGQTEVQLVAESRGRREDAELELIFLRTVNNGTDYVSADRFRRIQFKLHFLPKAMNIVGTQIADLAAYPIGRYCIDKSKPNPAYEIVKEKFYKGPGAVYGLKIVP
ncbi:MAG TPA: DUF3800 domain-containing protein [Chloroflexia bacterium]|jgi:hypothetical protein